MAGSDLGAALRAADARAADMVRARRLPEALSIYERMRSLAPQEAWIQVQQGRVLLLGDDAQQALAHFQGLTRRFPRLEAAWQGLGKARYDQQQCEQAVAAFSRAAQLASAPALAIYHRGMAHLLAGNFADGWRDYEQRLQVPSLQPRLLQRPRWDGGPLAGRRLLVICEQGYGDVFQFVRCLALLRDAGGPVVFECPAELRALLQPSLSGIELVPLRGRMAPDTPFDCYAHLLSLPFLTGLSLERVPAQVPYLQVEPLPRVTGGGLRAGVCWAGSPTHPQDLHRSCHPELLAPLARVPGVSLVALQKDRTHWPALPGLDAFLQPPPIPLDDFLATARVITSLDLVITVDTSVAHLAGALGVPVWLLLSRDSDWRWLVGRADSPWYPGMRIFRQQRLGAWAELLDTVALALAEAQVASTATRK